MPGPALDLTKRAKRRLVKPSTSFILGLALVALVASLHHRSDIKQGLTGPFVGMRFLDPPPPWFEVYIIKQISANGVVSWRTIDEGRDSWDELSKLLAKTPEKVFHVSLLARPVTEGIFAATQSTHRFTISRWGGRASRADRESIEPLFADWLQSLDRADLATIVREKSTSWIRWGGYLVNLFAIALLGAFLYSFGWLWDVPHWRARRRAGNNLCVRCGYALSGIPRDDLNIAICPECGEHNAPAPASTEPRP